MLVVEFSRPGRVLHLNTICPLLQPNHNPRTCNSRPQVECIIFSNHSSSNNNNNLPILPSPNTDSSRSHHSSLTTTAAAAIAVPTPVSHNSNHKE